MSILERAKKINIWSILAVCLILAASLALGGFKISALTAVKEPIAIDSSSVAAIAAATVASDSSDVKNSGEGDETTVVGSKSGTKYHLPDCPGAKRIIDKNKVIFKSPAEAEKAGYSPASNCPGLNQ